MTVDGKPYFPATECAKVLGYANTKDAIIRHCKGVVKHDLPTNGGRQTKNYIPEGDLYRLIIRSKLPAAERFERWVFDEVLPAIRKHGAYISDDLLDQLIDNPESATKLFARLKDERAQKAALEGQVERLMPKARYYDVILQCPGAVLTTVIAKDYGQTAVMFNKLLHALGIQFRYKTNKTWVLYHEHDTLFLGGQEKTTLKDMSEMLGKETIDLYNLSITKGTQESHGQNFQKLGKDLMSVDEIAVMPGDKCILRVRGERPFFSKKFDPFSHKNFKHTADATPIELLQPKDDNAKDNK